MGPTMTMASYCQRSRNFTEMKKCWVLFWWVCIPPDLVWILRLCRVALSSSAQGSMSESEERSKRLMLKRKEYMTTRDLCRSRLGVFLKLKSHFNRPKSTKDGCRFLGILPSLLRHQQLQELQGMVVHFTGSGASSHCLFALSVLG